MDALKELVKIVNRKRLSKIDVFDKTLLSQGKSNLYLKLYEGLENGSIKDDVSAAKYLYDNNEKDAKFRKLKSRFKSKLLKSILLFDIDEVSNSEVVKAYYDCLTYNQTIEIIIKLTGTNKLVYELVKDNYAKALKYNFYDILKNYSFYLISYFSLKGDKKSMANEEEKYLKFLDLAQKEQFAKYLYMKVAVEFNRPTPITYELLDEVKENLDRFYVLRKEINNPEIDFYYFYLAFIYYEYNNELAVILELCNEADTLMDNNLETVTNTRRFVISLYRARAFLYSRQYEKGIALINDENRIKIADTGYNWYVLKEIEFKLYLQTKNFEKAYEVYENVQSNKSFKRQVAQLTERWKIYHAYLVFMDSYWNKRDYKFSLPKFLNDVPLNSKDKSGFNFAIRVVEILFNAARKDYNLIFSKMDALRIYRSRYLNDNTYKRNHLFLSILLKAEKSGFNAKEMLKIDSNELIELRKQNNYIIAEWEIIPYEELWDIFTELSEK
jgi:hypothetical protein